MNKTVINDINGDIIEVTNLANAIKECHRCKKSPYIMASGHTVGENYIYMLEQLIQIRIEERKRQFSPQTIAKIENGEQLTKYEIGVEMEKHKPFCPARINCEPLEREDLVIAFNAFFGTDIK